MSSSVLPWLLALSDLHVAHPENRKIVSGLRPESERDWLLLAGDVGELSGDIEWVLGTLSERFATVVWTPGNHELWTRRADPVRLRGEERYLFLVEMCRRLGVITPEPTRVLRYPQFAQWCGTTRTHDWHVRFNAAAVVYGHLHIPRVTWHDGVRFEEVSIGYPREWRQRARRPGVPRQILPAPAAQS